jgi:hypothetical protein
MRSCGVRAHTHTSTHTQHTYIYAQTHKHTNTYKHTDAARLEEHKSNTAKLLASYQKDNSLVYFEMVLNPKP